MADIEPPTPSTDGLAPSEAPKPGKLSSYVLDMDEQRVANLTRTIAQERSDTERIILSLRPKDENERCRDWSRRERAIKAWLSSPAPAKQRPTGAQSASPSISKTSSTSPGSRLLSLPVGIRLQIYSYALTDASTTPTVVHIARIGSPKHYSRYHQHPPLRYTLEPPPTSYPTTALLLVNRAIYEEALPILYLNKIFHPSSLEGLLPIFLEKLTPFAISHIKRIRLSYPTNHLPTLGRTDRSKPFFHWAITCAQVARLSGTLHEVEVYGHPAVHLDRANHGPLLNPLCKIKTPKRFILGPGHRNPQLHNTVFQDLLGIAEVKLEAVAPTRRLATRLAAREEARRQRAALVQASLRAEAEAARKVDDSDSEDDDRDSGDDDPEKQMKEWARWAEENIRRMERGVEDAGSLGQFTQVLRSLTTVEPLEPVDLEAEGWDVISQGSGARTPRRTSSASGGSGHGDRASEWADGTASTSVADGEAGESDDDGSDWEVVEE